MKLAAEYKFEIIPDPDNPGETGAIEMATRVCVERGAESTLVIPADIPLIQAWELEEILKHAPAEGSVLVPAADGRGTNAAFRRPANLFPLRFGNDSFKPHHAAAQATGKPCVVLNLPGIAVDVDNPEDLQQLISLPGETRAQRLAREYARVGRALPPSREAAPNERLSGPRRVICSYEEVSRSSDESVAKRRKNAPHGAGRGLTFQDSRPQRSQRSSASIVRRPPPDPHPARR